MIFLYLKIVGIMFWVFSLIVVMIPMAMYVKSLVDDSLSGKYQNNSWKTNPYLVQIDKLLDAIGADTIESRIVAPLIIVAIATVTWIISIFLLIYIISAIHGKVREDKYTETVNKTK